MSDKTAVARKFLISGRVQGVGYRFYAKRLAEELGVSGWVKNLADGRVEARATGDPEVIDELLAGLRQGPVGARVDQIEVSELQVESAGAGFDIKF